MIRRGLPDVLKQETVEKVIIKSLERTFTVDRKNRLHAGDAGFCSRQSVLNASYSGDGKNDAKSMLYMNIGSAVHNLIQDSLHEGGRLLFKEYKVADIGINLGGYIDIICFMQGRIQILELKTAGTTLPGEIKEGHRQQATIYSLITGLEAQVVYVSRNVASYDGKVLIKAMPLNLTKESASDVMFSAAYSYFALQKGVVGPIPQSMNESKCGYCGYKEFCWRKGPVPNNLRLATKEEHKELIAKANSFVEEMIDPVKMKERRSGVLSFLSKNGTKHAKDLLVGSDWSKLFRSPL